MTLFYFVHDVGIGLPLAVTLLESVPVDFQQRVTGLIAVFLLVLVITAIVHAYTLKR